MAFFEKKEAVQTVTTPPPEAECDRRIAELERSKAQIVIQIGQTFLQNNTLEQAIGTPYEEYLRNIDAIDKECLFQEKRKLALKGLRKCEKCGNVLVLDSVFCNKCGEKLEPLFGEENQNQRVCPQCGAPYEQGAAFCTSCGKQLG